MTPSVFAQGHVKSFGIEFWSGTKVPQLFERRNKAVNKLMCFFGFHRDVWEVISSGNLVNERNMFVANFRTYERTCNHCGRKTLTELRS